MFPAEETDGMEDSKPVFVLYLTSHLFCLPWRREERGGRDFSAALVGNWLELRGGDCCRRTELQSGSQDNLLCPQKLLPDLRGKCHTVKEGCEGGVTEFREREKPGCGVNLNVKHEINVEDGLGGWREVQH